jgi:phenylpropionate dioxygenase-like ring-hydroxylating dioxygenase large terminal subunit
MMSAAQNALITLTARETPAGKLMRLYWQPAALAEELLPERPLKAVRLLGQDFVLFRDGQGRLGLLDRDCPHRGTDLAFGRLEENGLRCAFHGWLFDTEGQCLETPAEPENSRLCSGIRQKSYPVIERSGIIFAYLGAGTPPVLPAFDCFVAPPTHTFAFKGLIECNWLQALEVGIDPAHASYLHRFFEDEDADQAYGKQFRAASHGSDMPMTRVLREFAQPTIDVERTDFGLRIFALRHVDADTTHVRVTNLAFPHAFVIPMSADMTITQWHVPIDETSCYWYAIFTSFGTAVDKVRMREQRLALYELPAYRPRRNKSNNYGFDPEEQRTKTYTGMGEDINVHDQWAVESQGPIQDRTREHLGQSDKAISAYRRILIAAIEQVAKGERPLMALTQEEAARVTGPAVVDGIAATADWQDYWHRVDRDRRQAAPWGAPQHAA